MRVFVLLASVAAMAFTAPLVAQGHGGHGGHGGGNGGGGGGADQGGGRHGGASRGGGGGAERRGGSNQAARQTPTHGGGHETRMGAAPSHGPSRERGPVREAHRQPRGAERQVVRGAERHAAAIPKARNERAAVGFARAAERPTQRRFASRVDWRRPGFNWASVRIDCPPGLFKKGNGCLPPGQARKWFAPGQRFLVGGYPWDRDVFGYYDWFGFRPYAVPFRYSGFYYDGPGYYYSYYGGNIYRVSLATQLVLGLIPLLGGGFAVGEPLPIGYGVYNVPYGYRTVYYDRPDVWYRYGDHAIYAVDPETRLIEDVVALTTGDVVVGRPLPVGYDVYNVPFAYRDRYYDTDDNWYRYSDGYVYRVQPRTRVVETAILVT